MFHADLCSHVKYPTNPTKRHAAKNHCSAHPLHNASRNSDLSVQPRNQHAIGFRYGSECSNHSLDRRGRNLAFFIRAIIGPRLSVLDTERNATVELKTKKGISRIHLATIPVVNRKSIFGDTARDAEAGIGYPVNFPPVDENDFSHVSLPWLDAGGILPSLQISRNIQVKNPNDVIAALVESGCLKYGKISIERGIARGAVVLLGLESTGEIYLATRTPIKLSKPTENQMPSLPFWLAVSGDFDLIESDFFMAAALTWDKIARAQPQYSSIGELGPEKGIQGNIASDENQEVS